MTTYETKVKASGNKETEIKVAADGTLISVSAKLEDEDDDKDGGHEGKDDDDKDGK